MKIHDQLNHIIRLLERLNGNYGQRQGCDAHINGAEDISYHDWNVRENGKCSCHLFTH